MSLVSTVQLVLCSFFSLHELAHNNCSVYVNSVFIEHFCVFVHAFFCSSAQILKKRHFDLGETGHLNKGWNEILWQLPAKRLGACDRVREVGRGDNTTVMTSDMMSHWWNKKQTLKKNKNFLIDLILQMIENFRKLAHLLSQCPTSGMWAHCTPVWLRERSSRQQTRVKGGVANASHFSG